MISLVGNALAAKSTSLGMVIAGTTLISSAAAMHQIGFAAISEVAPRKRRPLAQGLFQSSLSIASATGPIIGKLKGLASWGFHSRPILTHSRICFN
jgi:predicted MFS family arabinose efflux permease